MLLLLYVLIILFLWLLGVLFVLILVSLLFLPIYVSGFVMSAGILCEILLLGSGETQGQMGG